LVTDSRLPLLRVAADPDASQPADRSRWPGTVPAVGQLLADGLDLGPLTVLVGENGSGKSTLVEAIAGAYGLSLEGGSPGARYSSRFTCVICSIDEIDER
jgi:predicted ATPase